MLVLSRKEGERIVIGDYITLVVSKVNGNRVTIGIEAPRDLKVVRGELYDDKVRNATETLNRDSEDGVGAEEGIPSKSTRVTLREFAASVLPSLQRQVG